MGLAAAKKRLDTSASNIANSATTGSTDKGGKQPYRSQRVEQTAVTDGNGNPLGVNAVSVDKDPAYVPAYDPGSPFADENGNEGVPNVSLAEEAKNMKLAGYAYKANAEVIEAAGEMEEDLLKTFDEEV